MKRFTTLTVLALLVTVSGCSTVKSVVGLTPPPPPRSMQVLVDMTASSTETESTKRRVEKLIRKWAADANPDDKLVVWVLTPDGNLPAEAKVDVTFRPLQQPVDEKRRQFVEGKDGKGGIIAEVKAALDQNCRALEKSKGGSPILEALAEIGNSTAGSYDLYIFSDLLHSSEKFAPDEFSLYRDWSVSYEAWANDPNIVERMIEISQYDQAEVRPKVVWICWGYGTQCAGKKVQLAQSKTVMDFWSHFWKGCKIECNKLAL